MTTLSLEVPETLFFALRKAPQKFLKDLRLVAAIKWYEAGEISEQSASELAGISIDELHQAVQRYQTTP